MNSSANTHTNALGTSLFDSGLQSARPALEDGRQAVMVEGQSEAAEPPALDMGGRISAEFSRKYAELGYAPEAGSWEGVDAGGPRVSPAQSHSKVPDRYGPIPVLARPRRMCVPLQRCVSFVHYG